MRLLSTASTHYLYIDSWQAQFKFGATTRSDLVLKVLMLAENAWGLMDSDSPMFVRDGVGTSWVAGPCQTTRPLPLSIGIYAPIPMATAARTSLTTRVVDKTTIGKWDTLLSPLRMGKADLELITVAAPDGFHIL